MQACMPNSLWFPKQLHVCLKANFCSQIQLLNPVTWGQFDFYWLILLPVPMNSPHIIRGTWVSLQQHWHGAIGAFRQMGHLWESSLITMFLSCRFMMGSRRQQSLSSYMQSCTEVSMLRENSLFLPKRALQEASNPQILPLTSLHSRIKVRFCMLLLIFMQEAAWCKLKCWAIAQPDWKWLSQSSAFLEIVSCHCVIKKIKSSLKQHQVLWEMRVLNYSLSPSYWSSIIWLCLTSFPVTINH